MKDFCPESDNSKSAYDCKFSLPCGDVVLELQLGLAPSSDVEYSCDMSTVDKVVGESLSMTQFLLAEVVLEFDEIGVALEKRT